MANVPNNETFSLQDVYTAVDSHSNPSQDLSSCFANAVAGYFDPNYNQDSYAPANSMKRFRNYIVPTYNPEFACIYNGPGGYSPGIISVDGTYTGPASWPSVSVSLEHTAYDRTNKVMVYGSPSYGSAGVVDFNVQALTNKTIDLPGSNSFGHIQFENGYWLLQLQNENGFYYRTSDVYSGINTISGTAITGTIPTSGVINLIQYNSTDGQYYYSTGNGEIGRLPFMGSNSAQEKLDILTYGTSVSTANGLVVAFSTDTDRYAATGTSTSWTNFSSGGVWATNNINVASNKNFIMDRSNYKVWTMTFGSGVTWADRTPSGYQMYDITVDGSTTYGLAYHIGTSSFKILQSSDGDMVSWSVYKNLTYSTYRLFKY